MLKECKVRTVNNAGILIPEFSLTTLMEECMDFKHEMSPLNLSAIASAAKLSSQQSIMLNLPRRA
jgi:hypothetical protein